MRNLRNLRNEKNLRSEKNEKNLRSLRSEKNERDLRSLILMRVRRNLILMRGYTHTRNRHYCQAMLPRCLNVVRLVSLLNLLL